MKNPYLLLTGLLIVALASCDGKCHKEVSCIFNNNEQPRCLLYGFSAKELDSITVKWFEQGSNFTKPVGSKTYKPTDQVYPAPAPYPSNFLRNINIDTTSGMDSFSCYPDLFHHGVYDAQLIIPGAGKVYTITDVKTDGVASEKLKYRCADRPSCQWKVTSLKVDGTEQNVAGYLQFVFKR